MLPFIPVAFLAFCQPVYCWGSLGHRTVAYLAEKHLTEDASNFVNELLANDRGFDISDAAIWADEIKNRRPYTKQWHYIDSQDDPPRTCGANFRRDCNQDGKPGCVVSAITNLTRRASDSSDELIDRKEALMYLIHFIGDIHQPLHTENLDRGGNEINVHFDGRKENLHGIWDSDILHKYRGLPQSLPKPREKIAAAQFATELFQAQKMGTLVADTKCNLGPDCSDIGAAQKCALHWATEANCRICTHVLQPSVDRLEENDLGDEYFDAVVPVVLELLGKAGVRLGAWINALAAAQAGGSLVRQKLGQEHDFEL